ncbi:NUDIX domain-containing protein [Psychromonas sp. RZ22]|uniref:NUDIX hydrolase n=1 Tax=Psychromonas algarum TaxID=2555643 RepID=UPI001068D23A|nr:NUDIX domain-containing protein [Psychromonas sp. RZ22]TEW55163.1 NUDIX domain-containing protein [Psychromonas sp. RZ22]
MHLLKRVIHPSITLDNLIPAHPQCFTRIATRAIVIKDNQILLMFTKRYNDYSLPGGGVDEGEKLIDGLKRELHEETGAHSIRNINAFGLYEEFRPHENKKHFSEYSIMHMLSYCFTCDIGDVLAENKLEDYEINNGMQVCWVNIDEAIKHNFKTINNDKKQGLSILRETYLMQEIKQRLMAT